MPMKTSTQNAQEVILFLNLQLQTNPHPLPQIVNNPLNAKLIPKLREYGPASHLFQPFKHIYEGILLTMREWYPLWREEFSFQEAYELEEEIETLKSQLKNHEVMFGKATDCYRQCIITQRDNNQTCSHNYKAIHDDWRIVSLDDLEREMGATLDMGKAEWKSIKNP